MKKYVGILCLLVLFLVSCSKTSMDEDGYRIFTIKKGEHSSVLGIQSFTGSVLNFNVIFDSSAIYTSKTKENQKDVNKLFGMSDCGINHHINSARVGWRWVNDSLELLAYVYCNAERKIQYITSCDLGREIVCSITTSGDKYLFDVNGVHYEEKRTCSGQEHYLLHPYFGGDEVAPHDITIKLNYDLGLKT